MKPGMTAIIILSDEGSRKQARTLGLPRLCNKIPELSRPVSRVRRFISQVDLNR